MFKKGVLYYNHSLDRMDIRFDNADTYGGLHCGECLEAYNNGEWVPTRVEMNEDWYFVGCPELCKDGTVVRI